MSRYREALEAIANLPQVQPFADRFEEAQRIASDALAGDEWIPIAERLPKEDVPVWLAHASTNGVGGCSALATLQNGKWYFVNSRYEFGPEPTHWQPIPHEPNRRVAT